MNLSIKSLLFVISIVSSVGTYSMRYEELNEDVDLGVIQNYEDLEVNFTPDGKIDTFLKNISQRATGIAKKNEAEKKALVIDIISAQDLVTKLLGQSFVWAVPNRSVLRKIEKELYPIAQKIFSTMNAYRIVATNALSDCIPERTLGDRFRDFFKPKTHIIFARYRACNAVLKSLKFEAFLQQAIQAKLGEGSVEKNMLLLAESLQVLHGTMNT